MKKLLTLISVLLVALGLASCGGDASTSSAKTTNSESSVESSSSESVVESSSSSSVDTFTLDFQQSETSISVDYASTVKLSDYFTCKGSDLVSYAGFITYSSANGTIENSKYLNTQTAGTYVVKANIKIAAHNIDETLELTVTVGAKVEVTNLISNPAIYSSDATTYDLFNGDGGSGSVSMDTIDSVDFAKVVITSATGNGAYSPRLRTAGDALVTLVPGQNYLLRFSAKTSIAARKMSVQVGEVLGGAPYFYAATTDASVFNLTQTLTPYQVVFTAKKSDPTMNMDNMSVLFEMGTVDGDGSPCDIWVGNVELGEYAGVVPDTTAPVIDMSSVSVFIGDAAPSIDSLISVTDDIDAVEDITVTSVLTLEGTEVTSIDSSVEGVYKLEITATDLSGNTVTKIKTINVVAAPATVFGTPNETIVHGAGATSAVANAAAPEQFHVWYDNAVLTPTYTAEVLSLDVTTAATWEWYGVQVFYNTPAVVNAGDYTLSFDLDSATAGVLTVGCTQPNTDNVEIPVVVGMNHITYSITGVESGKQLQLVFILGDATSNTGMEAGSYAFSNFDVSEVSSSLFGMPSSEIVVGGVANEASAVANPENFKVWHEAGVVEASWANKELTLNVTDASGLTQFWSVQIFYSTPMVTEAGNYALSFNVHSDVAGIITVQYRQTTAGLGVVQQEYNVVAGDNMVYVQLSNIIADANIDFAIFPGSASGNTNLGVNTLVFSNIDLATGLVPDMEAPTITSGDLNLSLNAAAPSVSSLVMVTDNQTAFENLVIVTKLMMGETEVTAIDTSAPGVYTLEITATDTAMLTSTKTITITVFDGMVPLFGVPSSVVMTGSEASEGNLKLAGTTEQFYVWFDAVTTNASYSNDMLTVEIPSVPEGSAWWAVQTFYYTPSMDEVANYELTIKINVVSDCTVSFKVADSTNATLNAGTSFALTAGDNDVTISFTSLVSGAKIELMIFYGVIDGAFNAANTYVFSDFMLTKVA